MLCLTFPPFHFHKFPLNWELEQPPVHVVCFISLGDHRFMQPFVQYLKTEVSYIFGPFLQLFIVGWLVQFQLLNHGQKWRCEKWRTGIVTWRIGKVWAKGNEWGGSFQAEETAWAANIYRAPVACYALGILWWIRQMETCPNGVYSLFSSVFISTVFLYACSVQDTVLVQEAGVRTKNKTQFLSSGSSQYLEGER